MRESRSISEKIWWLTRSWMRLLKKIEKEVEIINGQIYNVGFENHSVLDIAKMVKAEIGDDVQLEVSPTDDNRSYHVSSEKIKIQLGFKASRTIKDAIVGLKQASDNGLLPNSIDDEKYFNIKRMNSVKMK